MTTKTKKAPRKRTPPPPPCLCLECKREGCMGIGKPFAFDLPVLDLSGPDLGALLLTQEEDTNRAMIAALTMPPVDLGALLLALDTGADNNGPPPAAARLAIARAIIRNADAGKPIPARVVKMARAEVERLS